MKVLSLNGAINLNSINRAKCENNHNVHSNVSFPGGTDTFVRNLSSIQDVISVFDRYAFEVPIGLDLKVSPSNGKILGFSKTLNNGNILNVMKIGNNNIGRNIRYILFKELKDDVAINSIGVDIDSAELIKLNYGKPIVRGGRLELLKESDPEYADYKSKLNNYITLISTHDNYQENATTVEVLNAKPRGQRPLSGLNVETLFEAGEEMPSAREFMAVMSKEINMQPEDWAKAKLQFDIDTGNQQTVLEEAEHTVQQGFESV